MITKARRFLYTILLEQTKNMTIVTREQRGRLVLYLYNQGKMHTTVINGNTKDVEIHNSLDSCK